MQDGAFGCTKNNFLVLKLTSVMREGLCFWLLSPFCNVNLAWYITSFKGSNVNEVHVWTDLGVCVRCGTKGWCKTLFKAHQADFD